MKTIAENAQAAKEREYPYYGQSVKPSDGGIVLFTEPRTGFVVHRENNNYWEVGFHSQCWVEEAFVPFYGTIKVKP